MRIRTGRERGASKSTANDVGDGMLQIKTKEITYNSVENTKTVSHCILVAKKGGKNILLTHPNLYLYKKTQASISTSRRYSNIISMFYRFLSTLPKMKGKDLGVYHYLTDNRDIMLWQVQRQVDRLERHSLSPNSDTIYEDAKILLGYFHWLNEEGFVTNVQVQMRTWRANFKSKRMLSYIQMKAKSKIDASNIRVLDKKSRQRQSDFLITEGEIKLLLESYVDPVYRCIFNLALGTAMRPMDLVKFPFIGNRDNKHILTYSEMDRTQKTTTYEVYDSKGGKDRTISINMEDLKALEENYITPYYAQRKQLYKKKYGHPCPPDILFLNKAGDPVTKSMIASRTNDAKKKAMKADPKFREHLTFYQTRHWWPTQHIIATFGERLLTENLEVMYLATAQAIRDQMGHEDFETTYKHYIDMARVIMMVHKGHALDLIKAPARTVTQFISSLKLPDKIGQPDFDLGMLEAV